MDFKSICSKIDVDSIRAKIPPLPDMVTQIKLPKSMPKLKSRKIFRSSRDDLSSPHAKRSSSRRSETTDIAQQQQAVTIPPSDFVDHTPKKISTISSLVNQPGGKHPRSAGIKRHNFDDDDDDEINSYRSAGGIEDYCPSPLHKESSTMFRSVSKPRVSEDMSPGSRTASEPQAKKSFLQKVQKGYKDVSEFRLKHIFVKKTVVRQDTIQVDNYVNTYEEDRRKQQLYEARRNSGLSDDYDFEFKISSRKSDESFGVPSPSDSPDKPPRRQGKKTLSEQSGDESGMEQSPPKRKPGIAATRFARVRKEPLRMSLDEDDGIQQPGPKSTNQTAIKENHDDHMQEIPLHPLESALQQRLSETRVKSLSPQLSKSKTVKKGLGDIKNTSQEESLSLDDDDEEEEDEELEMDVVIDKRPEPPRPTSRPQHQQTQNKKKPVANIRGTSQEESLSMDDGDDEDEVAYQKNPHKGSQILSPIQSSLYNITGKKDKGSLSKNSSQDDSLSSGSTKRRKAPLRSQKSEDSVKSPSSDKPTADKPKMEMFKENIKRFQKSIKLPSRSTQSAAESDGEDNAEEKKKPSKSQQFAEKLKRFRSVENVDKHTEDETTEPKAPGSPLQKLTSKLQDWKKSFRKPATDRVTDDDEMNSPQQGKKRGTLIKRLQHIRMRKQQSTEDPDDDEEGGKTYRESFRSRARLQLEKGMAAASQMPQMTMGKIKESKKYFRKRQEKDKENDEEKEKEKDKEKEKENAKKMAYASGESDLEDSDEEQKKRPQGKAQTANRTSHYYSSDEERADDEEDLTKVTLEPYQPNVLVPLSRAAWTAKPILSDSTGDEEDDVLPRVLIHQDNSDVFESTLIIAVTRPVSSRSHTASPYITELPPDYQESPSESPKASTPETHADNWVPNREIISAFNAVKRPNAMKRDLSKDSLSSTVSPTAGTYSRNHSMDSSSDDSWMKGVSREEASNAIGLIGTSPAAGEEPWKVNGAKDKAKGGNLYKTKSIDIFELHKQQGDKSLHIFEDFDDELKNTPVVKIQSEVEGNATRSTDDEEDSSEEYDNAADDDNSSRITKILRQQSDEDVKVGEEVNNKTDQIQNPSEEVLHITEERSQEKSHSAETPKVSASTPDSNGNVEETSPQYLSTNTNVESYTLGGSRECLLNEENTTKNIKPLHEITHADAAATKAKLTNFQYANSQESLMGNVDPNETPNDDGEEEEDAPDSSYNEGDDEEDESEDLDRPPSAAPSPPPSRSPPPPPLPVRQISPRKSIPVTAAKERSPSPIPPVPQTKPPLPPNRPVGAPPKIPERTPSMSNVARPLVKTASLRLAYSEQVNPQDIGKVNKLISRFEGRPRIIPRRHYISQDSEDTSDQEDDNKHSQRNDNEKPKDLNRNFIIENEPQKILNIIKDDDEVIIPSRNISRDRTPTNLIDSSSPIETIAKLKNLEDTTKNNNHLKLPAQKDRKSKKTSMAPTSQMPNPETRDQPTTSPKANSTTNSFNQYDRNSNYSQSNSEYGSPMEFPSSLMGSTEVTPISERRETTEFLSAHRSRRSMTRDDDRFYSFDSDDENSYYSISSTGSSRYVVEL
ncbi:PIP82 [Haematobia irritans]|uniref:PIP82 n=1 Tax=Haematobia irritans TaxID=7368 RepID=UPI003F50B956